MNDKLKEIRDRVINNNPNSLLCLKATDNLKCLDDIQSETYQLGRQEVIDEMNKFITGLIDDTSIYGQQSSRNLRIRILTEWKSKLNNLKK